MRSYYSPKTAQQALFHDLFDFNLENLRRLSSWHFAGLLKKCLLTGFSSQADLCMKRRTLNASMALSKRSPQDKPFMRSIQFELHAHSTVHKDSEHAAQNIYSQLSQRVLLALEEIFLTGPLRLS
jgi:hypothetical protein